MSNERLRTAISIFLAFVILVAVVCMAGMLLLRFTVLDKDRLMARFDVDTIAELAYEELTSAFDAYGVAAGLPSGGGAAADAPLEAAANPPAGAAGSGYYEQALSLERVRTDVAASLRHAFDPKAPGPGKEGFRVALEAGIYKAAAQHGETLSEERTEALSYLSELCTQAYGLAVSIPAAVQLSALSERAEGLSKPLLAAAFPLLIASCVFLLALHPGRRRTALLHMLYGLIGAALFLGTSVVAVF